MESLGEVYGTRQKLTAHVPRLPSTPSLIILSWFNERHRTMTENSENPKIAPKKFPKKAATLRTPRPKRADGESDVLATYAAMQGSDREIGERLHAIVKVSAPDLAPKLWYGMPAYARDGKVVCFFQGAGKFKTRYATLGFMHEAKLDDGDIWPTAFAITGLNAAEEKKITALVKKAVG